MNRAVVWTLVAAISLALLGTATGVLVVVRPILHGDTAGSDPVRIDVPAGTSLNEIASRLHAAGVVRHQRIFGRYATLAHFDRQIRAGEYDFVAGESYRRILERLREGDIVQVKVTLPEGITCREIADTLERKVGIKRDDFMAAMEDSEFLRRHNIESPSLEGYLFPDTYFFPSKTSAHQAIEMMLQRFFTVWTPKMEEKARALGMTRGQVLSLASIIENEALLDAERPHISAVYHNRLDRDMLLQADPTVLYALGGIHRRVLFRDLRTVSPYNTYQNPGLPPGPICNPGYASITAAVDPMPGSSDLFFVAAQDGSGRHVFTRSLPEHLAAKRRADLLMERRAAAAAGAADTAPAMPQEDLSPAPPEPEKAAEKATVEPAPKVPAEPAASEAKPANEPAEHKSNVEAAKLPAATAVSKPAPAGTKKPADAATHKPPAKSVTGSAKTASNPAPPKSTAGSSKLVSDSPAHESKPTATHAASETAPKPKVATKLVTGAAEPKATAKAAKPGATPAAHAATAAAQREAATGDSQVPSHKAGAGGSKLVSDSTAHKPSTAALDSGATHHKPSAAAASGQAGAAAKASEDTSPKPAAKSIAKTPEAATKNAESSAATPTEAATKPGAADASSKPGGSEVKKAPASEAPKSPEPAAPKPAQVSVPKPAENSSGAPVESAAPKPGGAPAAKTPDTAQSKPPSEAPAETASKPPAPAPR